MKIIAKYTSQTYDGIATFLKVFASRAAAEPYDGVIKGVVVVVEGTFCVFAHFWHLNAYESV